MATRGAFSVVASIGDFAGAFGSGLISKPSIDLFHTSCFAFASTYDTPASGLVRLTFAPPFRRRFTSIAESAPLYGKRYTFAAPPLLRRIWYFGVAVSFCSTNDSANGVRANSVFTPYCIRTVHT